MEITDEELNSLNQVKISPRPREISVDGLSFQQSMCIKNSIDVARKNLGVNVVEGIIIAVQQDKSVKPMAHAWNELDGKHFDVTSEFVWTKDKEDVAINSEIRYCSLLIFEVDHQADQFSFAFSQKTLAYVEAIKKKLSSKNSNQ